MRSGAVAARLGVLALLLPSTGAAFARGSARIDLRDEHGTPARATVTLRGADGQDHVAARVGDVYVSDALVAGDYQIAITSDGAGDPSGEWRGATRVRVRERRVSSAVLVRAQGPQAATGKRHRARGAATGTLRGDEAGCDAPGGTVVAALVFAAGRPAAGKLEVRAQSGRRKGSLLCVEAVAGGTADLALAPGDYLITAELVGGARARVFYRFLDGKAPPPLALRLP